MKLTGGPADPRSRVEFTDWPGVDRIAMRIADLHGETGDRMHRLVVGATDVLERDPGDAQ